MIVYGKFVPMSIIQRKRLCWNCEGSVSLSEETCPFCGVSVVPAFLDGSSAEFAPPYSSSPEKDYAIPKSPYDMRGEKLDLSDHDTRSESSEPGQETDLDEFKRVAIAVTLLLSGSVFFIFSLALGLFSNESGVLTLHWDGSYWYIYTLFALPLILFGWRSLSQLDKELNN